jgi:hypothetical protein
MYVNGKIILICRGAQVVRVLVPVLDENQRQT